MFIPGLFSILEKIIGPLFEGHAASIAAKVMGISGNPTVQGILSIIEGTVGQLENQQKLELEAEIQTLLTQSQIDLVEAQSPSFFHGGWRPALAWGLTAIIISHLTLAEGFNIAIALGYSVGTLAPLDSITLSLMFGLLGLYMGARTIEKVNANSEDNQ